MIPPTAIPSTYESHNASKVDNFIELNILSILSLYGLVIKYKLPAINM